MATTLGNTGTAHVSEKAARAAYDRLVAEIAGMDGVVVAFSGGVDSSLLVAASRDALGDHALAVTACSASYPAEEKDLAVSVANLLGARHEIIESQEIDDAKYRSNPTNRCYYCKRQLFGELAAIARREGASTVLDGTNRDDHSDTRPGQTAAAEYGVRSPLADLGFKKDLVRAVARWRGLPNWDHPPGACLASRVPYGREITAELLARLGNAERSIRELGFRQVRVRDHGEIARIEVIAEEMARANSAKTRHLMVAACKQQGYTYVSLDLEGYRTGSMNESLCTANPPPAAVAREEPTTASGYTDRCTGASKCGQAVKSTAPQPEGDNSGWCFGQEDA